MAQAAFCCFCVGGVTGVLVLNMAQVSVVVVRRSIGFSWIR